MSLPALWLCVPAYACCTHSTQVSTPDARRDLLSHSLLKSYQTQASAHGSGTDLTVGLLVPQVSPDQADSQQQALKCCAACWNRSACTAHLSHLQGWTAPAEPCTPLCPTA